jgi:hypothetical protein
VAGALAACYVAIADDMGRRKLVLAPGSDDVLIWEIETGELEAAEVNWSG